METHLKRSPVNSSKNLTAPRELPTSLRMLLGSALEARSRSLPQRQHQSRNSCAKAFLSRAIPPSVP